MSQGRLTKDFQARLRKGIDNSQQNARKQQSLIKTAFPTSNQNVQNNPEPTIPQYQLPQVYQQAPGTQTTQQVYQQTYQEKIESGVIPSANELLRNIEDSLLSEEAQNDLQILHNLVPPDPEEQARDEEEKDIIVENLELQDSQAEYSRQLFQLEDSIYVPWNCNRLVRSCNFVEICSPIDDTLPLPEWRPVDYDSAFGSYDNYTQGLGVPKVDAKLGNLQNTYLLYLGIRNIRNDFPFPVGILFGEVDGNEWKPLEKRTRVFGARDYHMILQPKTTVTSNDLKDVVCFKSGPEINHYYSQAYPSYFADNLDQAIKPTGRNMTLIPERNPVIEYIFKSASKWGWNLPQLGTDASTAGYFMVENSVAQQAIQDTREIFNRYLKITNLETLSIRFVKFDKTTLYARDKEIELGTQNGDKLYGITFELNSVHVFKDRYSSLDKDEEDVMDRLDGMSISNNYVTYNES